VNALEFAALAALGLPLLAALANGSSAGTGDRLYGHRTAARVAVAAVFASFLASVFISIGGEQTSIQESYDILVNLTILIYFVPYLYLFAAWIRLRGAESSISEEQVMTMTRGMGSVWLVAGCGFSATFIAIALVFVPPPGTESVFNYQANLVGQAMALFAIGAVFYVAARRQRPS